LEWMSLTTPQSMVYPEDASPAGSLF
jgi:hypothetical protein